MNSSGLAATSSSASVIVYSGAAGGASIGVTSTSRSATTAASATNASASTRTSGGVGTMDDPLPAASRCRRCPTGSSQITVPTTPASTNHTSSATPSRDEF